MVEHRNDLRQQRTTNSLVMHAKKYSHLSCWRSMTALHTGLEKKKRKIVEAAYIAVRDHKPQRRLCEPLPGCGRSHTDGPISVLADQTFSQVIRSCSKYTTRLSVSVIL
ncbi:hypothetical protein E2C01_083116 [Portunus trituberculatus]|uniref:Uncharacterized protein n=1 Tax=Portunus trituberculatus TaxID=210409 RepID=A0A5B7J5J3_PORTR|nr:hypothetical protein [Portunus trituberculatus]